MANCYDFVSFQNYTLGYGAIRELRRLTQGFGQRYYVILDHHATDKMVSDIKNSLTVPPDAYRCPADNMLGRSAGLLDSLPAPDPDAAALDCEFFRLRKQACSFENARTLWQSIAAARADVVVALGGSKCLDLVRAALHFSGAYQRPKLVLCPTIIASNASSNGMSVLYDEDSGLMSDFWNLAVMPECVIVDTEIIIQTPVSAFVAGIGDQIASSTEALHTLQRMGLWDDCDPLCISHHQAVLDVLKKYSVSAVQAMKRREVTKEFEWVCHALTRYTGPQLAVATSFFAHILDEALISMKEVASRMHGEVVGYGVLPEMVAFGTPQEMYPWVDLYLQLGIPVDLRSLGIPDCGYEDILNRCRAGADKIMATRALLHWEPEEMADAVMEADRLVSAYTNR